MEKLIYERPIIKKHVTGMPNKFGMKVINEPITHIEDIAVTQLIEQYGSPLYVISENTIRKTYREAKKAFEIRYPKFQFAWSYKTNYLDAVCQVYHQEGSWAEVVSGFEYDKAIRNGVSGKQIIFNGPDKSDEDLMKATKNGSYIHIDNFDELYSLIALCDKMSEKPKVAIRVNMDTGIFPQWDRFGFNYENGEAWKALTHILTSEKLELVGLHCHIGTYVMNASAYAVAASKLADLAVGVKTKYKKDIKYIDLGGGFTSKNTLKGAYLPASDTNPTFDDYAEAISTALLSSNLDPQNMPTLILESGRALIDDAGTLLGSVQAIKRLADGRRAMVINVGVNLLFTAFWYEHNIVPAQAFTHYTEDTVIYGPLCMNIDVIRENINFPILRKGDNIVINRIGAYNMTQWLQFITLRPNIVMIDTNGKTHLIREKETNENITNSEKLPIHLQKK